MLKDPNILYGYYSEEENKNEENCYKLFIIFLLGIVVGVLFCIILYFIILHRFF